MRKLAAAALLFWAIPAASAIHNLKYFGYWGDTGEETLGQSNFVTVFFQGTDANSVNTEIAALNRARDEGRRVVIGAGGAFFQEHFDEHGWRTYYLNDDYQARWKSLADIVRPYSGNIIAFYLVDEPDVLAGGRGPNFFNPLLSTAADAIHADFKDTPVAFNYGGVHSETVPPIGVDWIGLEVYGPIAPDGGGLKTLKGQLRVGQKMFVVTPAFTVDGGAPPSQEYVVDAIDKIWQYAANDDSIVALLAFCYYSDYSDPSAKLRGANELPKVKARNQEIFAAIQAGVVARYSCKGELGCQPDENGPFVSSNCENICGDQPPPPPPAPLQRYSCQGSRGCLPDDNGASTSADCDNKCVGPAPTPVPPPRTPFVQHYSCQGARGCLPDDHGPSTSSTCDNQCGGGKPPTTTPAFVQRYSCQGARGCLPDDHGPSTSPTCDNQCAVTPASPVVQRYSCQGARGCMPDDNGPSTSPDCDNQCKAAPPKALGQICVTADTQDAYFIVGPDNFGWKGSHCWDGHTPGLYRINAANASVKPAQATLSAGGSVNFDVQFKSGEDPISSDSSPSTGDGLGTTPQLDGVCRPDSECVSPDYGLVCASLAGGPWRWIATDGATGCGSRPHCKLASSCE